VHAGGCGCSVHFSAAGQGKPEKESGMEVADVQPPAVRNTDADVADVAAGWHVISVSEWTVVFTPGMGLRVQRLGLGFRGLGVGVEG